MAICNNINLENLLKAKDSATPVTIPGFGEISAFNGANVISEDNVKFRLQTIDPESVSYPYKDTIFGSGSDGKIDASNPDGKIRFYSESVFLKNQFEIEQAIRLVVDEGSNEGNFDILKYQDGYFFIIRNNDPIPPPDLPNLFKKLFMKLSGMELKSPLNPNYGKDVIDQVIGLFDKFMPFLMAYKFFLPILKLILCILEIFCAMPNPIKVAAAMQRLFRDCVPLFLSLFPIIALILMIINILVLIVQIILYIILLITNIVNLIIKNLKILYQAIDRKDAESILAVAAKIGRIICLLQNIFVVLLMANLFFQIFKDLIKSFFAIPPCDDSDNSSFQNCCTPDVCPKFIKNGDFERSTGSLLYTSASEETPGSIPDSMKSFSKFFTSSLRQESFQFYDEQSSYYQEFINMVDPKDAPSPVVIFPADSTYDKNTPPNQAPYLVDVKFFYNPADFGRKGDPRYVVFKDCIVTGKTVDTLTNPDGSSSQKPTGVVKFAGGKGFEEDGVTKLLGYTRDNVETKDQATLETFVFLGTHVVNDSTLTSIEGVDFLTFSNLEYKFKINHKVLVSKGLITYSCMPEINNDRAFTNAVFSSDLNLKIAELQNFPFPNIDGAIDCVNLAIDAFKNNLTEQGAETLKTTAIACMQQLKDEVEEGINVAIPLAFDQYKSTFSLTPEVQFTTDKIKVQVDLKESSGTSLLNLLPQGSADYVAKKIFASASLGQIGDFVYTSGIFEAEISSDTAGNGFVEVSFDGKKVSDITPENRVADLSKPLQISSRKADYQFIYSPSKPGSIGVGTGDSSDGSPERDLGDVSRMGYVGGAS